MILHSSDKTTDIGTDSGRIGMFWNMDVIYSVTRSSKNE